MLVEKTLDTIRVLVFIPRKGKGRPRKRFPRLLNDRVADSLPLRERLMKERKTDLICRKDLIRGPKFKTDETSKLSTYVENREDQRMASEFLQGLVSFDHKIRCIWILSL